MKEADELTSKDLLRINKNKSPEEIILWAKSFTTARCYYLQQAFLSGQNTFPG